VAKDVRQFCYSQQPRLASVLANKQHYDELQCHGRVPSKKCEHLGIGRESARGQRGDEQCACEFGYLGGREGSEMQILEKRGAKRAGVALGEVS